MLRAIKRPREEISSNAPRLIQIQINPEKIGLVIGPGGKTIRRLQDETGAKIDIEDSGIVTLSSLDAAFLRTETQTGHMHVGWLSTLDLPPGVDRFDADALERRIAGRLHLVPRLRQRVVDSPLGIGESA